MLSQTNQQSALLDVSNFGITRFKGDVTRDLPHLHSAKSGNIESEQCLVLRTDFEQQQYTSFVIKTQRAFLYS